MSELKGREFSGLRLPESRNRCRPEVIRLHWLSHQRSACYKHCRRGTRQIAGRHPNQRSWQACPGAEERTQHTGSKAGP
jgi:hypothetical protein